MCVLNPLPPLISISSCPHPLVSLHMFSHAPLFCLQLLPLCEYQHHFWPLLESAFWPVQLPGEFSHSNTIPYLCLKQISFWPLYLSTPFSEILTYPCLLFLAFLCLVSGQGSMDFTSSMPLAVISFFPPPLKPHVHPHWLYFNIWICFLTGLFTSCNRWVLDSSVSFTALKHRYEGNFALLKTSMSQLTLL